MRRSTTIGISIIATSLPIFAYCYSESCRIGKEVEGLKNTSPKVLEMCEIKENMRRMDVESPLRINTTVKEVLDPLSKDFDRYHRAWREYSLYGSQLGELRKNLVVRETETKIKDKLEGNYYQSFVVPGSIFGSLGTIAGLVVLCGAFESKSKKEENERTK